MRSPRIDAWSWVPLAVLCAIARAAAAEVIDGRMHHLRPAGEREWEGFPERAEGSELVVVFQGRANADPVTLSVRQRDVKQAWQVRLNGKKVASLVQDENDIRAYWDVAAGVLRGGDNELRISCEAAGDRARDDVSVGEVELIARRRDEVLGEASVAVEVVDADSGLPLPCRITVADEGGALASTGTPTGGRLAVRPGVVYCRDGGARIALRAGRYVLYASRGFEYSLASQKVDLEAGGLSSLKLAIRRVVPTEGLVSCDTHVHTLTYSRHGDATLEERMVTLAGEGIELPVSTEHNLQADYSEAAERAGVRKFFTPVTGNELTTAALGHFNVFPLRKDAALNPLQVRDWRHLSTLLSESAPDAVVVLNHARDVHGGFRPFDSSRHISIAGEPVDGVFPPANAMEVINSGATRADPLELFRDHFGLLNRGRRLTPVGASDSHDVARYIVGQARTYIDYSPDTDPAAIDTPRAIRALREGRAAVSYGLLARLTVDGRFTPGDLATVAAGATDLHVDVLGPEWTTAARVALYVNGTQTHHADIPQPADPADSAGVKWQGRFTLPRPRHDVHLVAIATGPGVTGPWWPCAKPYQPTSPRFTPYVLGATAPVYVDADGNGRFDAACDYARRLVADAGGDLAALSARLADYDQAVAVQAASALRARDPQRFEDQCRRLIESAPAPVARGVSAYLKEWALTTATSPRPD